MNDRQAAKATFWTRIVILALVLLAMWGVSTQFASAATQHLDGNQPLPTIEERALEQANEYMRIVNRLTDERDEARQDLVKSITVIRTLIDQKAAIAGDLAEAKSRMIDMEHELGLAKGDVVFKEVLMIFLMIVVSIYTLGVIYQRRVDEGKPGIPFFSSWIKRDLVVKPTVKEE